MNCNKLNPVTIKTSVQTDTKQNLFDIDPNSDVEIITVMPLFKNCNSGNSEAEKCNSTLIEHQESGEIFILDSEDIPKCEFRKTYTEKDRVYNFEAFYGSETEDHCGCKRRLVLLNCIIY